MVVSTVCRRVSAAYHDRAVKRHEVQGVVQSPLMEEKDVRDYGRLQGL